jgi:hypothetical protein
LRFTCLPVSLFAGLPVIEINALTGKLANHLTIKQIPCYVQGSIKTSNHNVRIGQDFLIFKNFSVGYAKSGKIVSSLMDAKSAFYSLDFFHKLAYYFDVIFFKQPVANIMT